MLERYLDTDQVCLVPRARNLCVVYVIKTDDVVSTLTASSPRALGVAGSSMLLLLVQCVDGLEQPLHIIYESHRMASLR